ncbi:MAG: YggS family pyridoxal phosphate-dependent enzyme [Clostridia bacterium]|nr:YggS family pyridoxal phosphate-dependent enzyme [Clostridia bacterium]
MEIGKNLAAVQLEIRQAAEAAGRNPEDVRLIAVSKTKPVSMIEDAVEWGMLDFGENRPQELAEKFLQVPGVRWHQIGQLQRNKVKYIIDKASLIHSVDSLPLAEEIEKRAAAIQKVQDILVQVNISGEESKSGVKPEDAAALCRRIGSLPHVRICGLMTISMAGLSPEGNFEVFSALKRLSEKIDQEQIPGVFMEELSMGMSHDFKEAIAAGATMVRVGSSIFGTREYR